MTRRRLRVRISLGPRAGGEIGKRSGYWNPYAAHVSQPDNTSMSYERICFPRVAAKDS